ncbi:CAF17-like 4Fe-4S cluster assembly/insertion protein YgfZ [Granulosicoccus sp. 3-233]|uniref:CAF17-like 4Fe-4S cluster assembly/insertion protein YgfZ n=1 Tax=Granulosicoccus sp. 3-233 TaxID=3417969 RepID=UPI003D32BE9D
MSNEWAEALTLTGMEDIAALREQGASVSVDTEAQPQLVDLSSLCVVDITGDDATSFLQGQFSNDLGKVSTEHAQITGYCTPKGRLLALPIVIGLHDGYRLLIPADIREGFLKRLSMFIMRAKVQVSERKDWTCTGIQTARGGELGSLAGFLGNLPASVMEVASDAHGQLLRWHDTDGSGSRARYLYVAEIPRQLALWREGEQLPKAGQALWRLGDIRAGQPSITAGVLEAFVPQMLNLQLVDGLSFTKGCYPGQEIVARMQYLGKLKRHMRRFSMPHAADQVIPVPGDALVTATDEDAGRVVDAVAGPDGLIELLAVVKVSGSDDSLSFQGRTLSARELPYELPSLADVRQDAG